MQELKLFMVLLGCRLKNRHTEQHDMFFGVATSIQALVPDINHFWPEAKGRLHIDAWREVTNVDGYGIKIVLDNEMPMTNEETLKLFFLNLGGYKPQEFEEYHYKMLAVGKSITEPIRQAKQTAFYKHFDIAGAPSHIDDKYGIDVDDAYEVKDILPAETKSKYSILIEPATKNQPDEMHLGYFPLDKL
ncbi:DUF1543 domain-containing protein [Parasediminibacterium sp. JCM 36343]|uniref:DUF1543 domain-containing protein n=1 Tax=Parasediminibacterium sp. JCM 36343 TaxID=3374279 RepID=UPI003978B701